MTAAEIVDKINAFFADNNTQEITEAKLREVCKDIVDFAASDRRPYKIYNAILNQDGASDDPTAFVLENTFAEEISWSITGANAFSGLLGGALEFPEKTIVLFSYGIDPPNPYPLTYSRASAAGGAISLTRTSSITAIKNIQIQIISYYD